MNIQDAMLQCLHIFRAIRPELLEFDAKVQLVACEATSMKTFRAGIPGRGYESYLYFGQGDTAEQAVQGLLEILMTVLDRKRTDLSARKTEMDELLRNAK